MQRKYFLRPEQLVPTEPNLNGVAHDSPQEAIDLVFAEACDLVEEVLAQGLPEGAGQIVTVLCAYGDQPGRYTLVSDELPFAPPPDLQTVLIAQSALESRAEFPPIAMVHLAQAWIVVGMTPEQRDQFAGQIKDHPQRRDAVTVSVFPHPDSGLAARHKTYLVTLVDGLAYLAPDHDALSPSVVDSLPGDDRGAIKHSGRLPALFWGVIDGKVVVHFGVVGAPGMGGPMHSPAEFVHQN